MPALVTRCLVLLTALLWMATPPLRGHEINTSYTSVVMDSSTVRFELQVDVMDLEAMVAQHIAPGQDVTPGVVVFQLPRLQEMFEHGVELKVPGQVVRLHQSDYGLRKDAAGNAFGRFVFTYRVKHPPSELDVRLSFFQFMGPRHKNLVKIQYGTETQQSVLTSDFPTERFVFASAQRSGVTLLLQFLKLGIEHIFIGYDHILFLIGLILIGGRFLNLLRIVTAFTIAHSITLVLATLGFVQIPSRVVETVIALSIVYIAVENFLVKQNDDRWMIAFIFGLMHGFGFASVLTGMGLPTAAKVSSLLSFNVGVEVGQLVIVALCYPFVTLSLNSRWKKQIVYAVSSVILFFGVAWFIERAFALDFAWL